MHLNLKITAPRLRLGVTAIKLSFLLAAMFPAMLLRGDGASLVAAKRDTRDATFFPIAVWYSGGKARAPMLEPIDSTSAQRWGHDLDQIKSVGFNTVKTWVDWATAEPQPGKFNFENLELLMKLAQQRGLRVVIQMYLDSAPDWVGQKFPDSKFVDRSGAVIESQSAPGFCIDHPGVRAEVQKFLTAVAERANKYNALYGWDVWSEPHVINWAEFPYLPAAEFCYCPNSQRRFRAWLQAKYGTLDALNKAWYRNFTAWDEVTPPRSSTILSYTDYLDWRAFITDKISGDLKTRVDAVRAADTQHFITSHAAVPALFTSPTNGYGEPDDFQMSAIADFFGTSIYPKHAASTRPWPWQQISAALDFSRSAGLSNNKAFWIGELQAGQGVTGMRLQVPVTAQDEERWLWTMIAHGAKQVAIYAWYPMSSGYESGGYGLINLDGTLTDRARAAGKVAQLIAANACELMAAQPPKAEVAVLYNRLGYMVGGAQPSLSRLGNATRDSLMGLHRIFTEAQIPLDFVSSQDAVRGRLSDYKIVFVPFPVMMSRDVAAAIKSYVQNGGTVVAEARPAWNDERGYASDTIPGMGLDEVFGVHEAEMRPVETAEVFSSDGKTLSFGDGYEETLVPSSHAQLIAKYRDGSGAAANNPYGQGHAILIGTFAAMHYQRHPEKSETAQWILKIANDSGVQKPILPAIADTGQTPSLASDFEVRRLAAPDEQFVFLFNYADKPLAPRIRIQLPFTPGDVRNLLTGAREQFQADGSRLLLSPQIEPGNVVVLKISSK